MCSLRNKDIVTNVLIYENIIENKSFAESQQAAGRINHNPENFQSFTAGVKRRKNGEKG